METAYIVVKLIRTARYYFAGTSLAGSAPRWSSDYADAVQFPARRTADTVVRSWGGTVQEVDR